MAALLDGAAAGAVMPSVSNVLCEGYMLKSPGNADKDDPDKSTGLQSWRRRFFRLLPGGPQMLHYFVDERGGSEEKGAVALVPGCTVETFPHRVKFLLRLCVPGSFGKEKKGERFYWLDCETKEEQAKWFTFLSRSCMWEVANARVMQLSVQFFSSSLAPVDLKLEASKDGGSLHLATLTPPHEPPVLSRVPLFGHAAFHGEEPSQAWISSSCPRRVKSSLFLGPPELQRGEDAVENAMRVLVQIEGSESMQLVAHCPQAARLLCHTINACDLSNPVTAIHRVFDLLAYVVSEDLAACNHPEHNVQVLVAVFRDWALSTLWAHPEVALALCARRPDATSSSLVTLVQALSRPKTTYCDVASGLFVIDVIDVLIRHTRNARVERVCRDGIVTHLETIVVPALAQLLDGVARQPAFVHGVLQDLAPDWITANLLELKISDMPTVLANDLKRLSLNYAGNVTRFLPPLKIPPTFDADRKAMLLAHVDSREPRILQRLLYLLLAITNDESSFLWLLRQPAAVAQLAGAMQRLAQYTLLDDPFLSRSPALHDMRAGPTLSTLGAVVPTLLVMFDNISAFLADPDRPAPDAASVTVWTDTIWPAIVVVMQATATIEPSKLLLQFLDPSRFAPGLTLPKAADLASFRRDICTAIYPLRRRGGLLWGSDKGSTFSATVDISYLAFDHLHHALTKLAPRIAAVNTPLVNQLYEWYHARYPENTEARTWPIANGRVLALNGRLETLTLEPRDVAVEMSGGGGTLIVTDMTGPIKSVLRIPLFGVTAFHANEPNQAWVSSSCPSKVDDPRWLGQGTQSAFHVRNSMRLIVQRPLGEPLQFVAHCEWHARLLCVAINASDLFDPVAAAQRVFEVLAYTVSKDFGACDHFEHNSQLLVKSLRSWLLFTLERHIDVAAALCRPGQTGATICDLIMVLSLPKTLYRNQDYGMFVVDLLDTLSRLGRDRRVEPAKSQPIARYMEHHVFPTLVALLAEASELPAFVRGVLQDSGDDWHVDKLFDGRGVVETIKSDSEAARKNMTTARSLPVLNEIPSFVEQRRKLLGMEGQALLITAHTDATNPRVLLRLVYLLVSLSSDDTSAQWLYRQPAAIKQLAIMLQSLAAYVLDGDPHLSHNRALYDLRAPHTLRTWGAIVPALVVFFDNLAVVNDGVVPAETVLSLWNDAIFPAISAALLSTTTTAPTSLIWQFLPAGTGKAVVSLELSSVNSEICSVLELLRRRENVLCDDVFDGRERPGMGFRFQANVCLLAYDHLYHLIRQLSKHSPPLRQAAVTHLLVLCDAVLTRVVKTEKNPVGELELLCEPRFTSLDYILNRVVAQFPDTHTTMLTGDGGARLAHTLEVLSFHFGDLAFSSTAKTGIYSIVLFFEGLAALVPKATDTEAVAATAAALQKCVLPHIVKLAVECFSHDQIFLLHHLCSDPSIDIRNHIPNHTSIAKSVFDVLGNLLRLPPVAALACENHAEQLKRLVRALVSIDDLDDLAQIPLAVSVCSALLSLGSVVDHEREHAGGAKIVQTAIAQALLPEATRVLEQLCNLDSITVFAISRLLFVWLKDETAAVALTRIPPTEGLLKVIRHLGNQSKIALKYQDRWILRIINRLLTHSANHVVAEFLSVSVAYELMVTLHNTVRAVGSSDGWPSLVSAIDVARRIIGYGSKAASVVCDRLDDAIPTLVRTLRSLVATQEEVARKRMVAIKSDDAVFIASLIAALASHVSADPVIARTFRGCEEIESILVMALETNVEDISMRRYLLHTLASLVLNNRGHAEQVCNANNATGVRIICKMLRHADRNIHGHAAVVLGQLVAFVPACIKDLRDCGGYTDLIDRLAASDQSDLSRLALVRLLVRLTAVEQAVVDLLDRDIVEMLVGFLGRFQGESSDLRYTLFYELGILRAFMNMCSHAAVRTRLLESPLLDALRKIQNDLPQDLMTIDAIGQQLQSSGNEEEGIESFLTNPRVLSELSDMMKHKLEDVDLHMLEDQKSRVRNGQRMDRHLTKEKLFTQFTEAFTRLEKMPKSLRGLEIAVNYVASLLEDQLSGDETAEMCHEPVSATVAPADQRRFGLAQARCINQLVALLTNLPEAGRAAARGARDPVRMMISYTWGPYQPIAIKLAEALRSQKHAVESVWIDIDNMHAAGSIYDGMAQAVQNSDCIVVLPCAAYERSANCNLEIKYCQDLRKKIFHVKVEKTYSPRGLVGLILSGLLYVDLSEKFETRFPELVAQIAAYVQGDGSQARLPGSDMVKSPLPLPLPADAPPGYSEVVGARPSAGAASVAAAAAVAYAAAAGPVTGAGAEVLRPDSLKKLLTLLDLEDHIQTFKDQGVTLIADVLLWTQDELEGIGLKKGEAKRLLANAVHYK